MTQYYLEVRMCKPTGQYWTIGLSLEADSFRRAVSLYDAWALGVQTVSGLSPSLEGISARKSRGKGYSLLDDFSGIKEELMTFMIDKE